MAEDTGPPKGELKFMTPFKIADDPPTPQPIPNLVHPEKTLAERAAARFSLAGQNAIGGYLTFERTTLPALRFLQ